MRRRENGQIFVPLFCFLPTLLNMLIWECRSPKAERNTNDKECLSIEPARETKREIKAAIKEAEREMRKGQGN